MDLHRRAQEPLPQPLLADLLGQVPAGTKAGDYTSSQQILRDPAPPDAGPRPAGAAGAIGDQRGWAAPRPAIAEFQPPKVRHLDYLDGEQVASLDFGNERFEWNEDGEVIEQPLFVLVTCVSSNHCDKTGAPSIGGTGPLFARRPAIAPAGKPRFGSFWRLPHGGAAQQRSRWASSCPRR
jgi:hypothetical protein